MMTHIYDEEGKSVGGWFNWKTMIADECEVKVTSGTIIALSRKVQSVSNCNCSFVNKLLVRSRLLSWKGRQIHFYVAPNLTQGGDNE